MENNSNDDDVKKKNLNKLNRVWDATTEEYLDAFQQQLFTFEMLARVYLRHAFDINVDEEISRELDIMHGEDEEHICDDCKNEPTN